MASDVVKKQPRLAPAAGRRFRARPFLEGKFPDDAEALTYFGPGQTPLVALDYATPTSWLPPGSLLRPPKTVWVTLNFPTIFPVTQQTPDFPEWIYYDKFSKSVRTVPENSYEVVHSPDLGVHYFTQELAYDVDDTLTYAGTKKDPEIVSVAVTFPHPMKARYRAIRDAILGLLQEIQAEGKGRVTCLLIDLCLVQKADVEGFQLFSRENYDGQEIIDGTGARVLDLFDMPHVAGEDAAVILTELLAPRHDRPFFGTNFIHIHVGIPSSWRATDDSSSEIIDPAARVAYSGIADKAPEFSGYRCLLYGLERVAIPNKAKGVGQAPIFHGDAIPDSVQEIDAVPVVTQENSGVVLRTGDDGLPVYTSYTDVVSRASQIPGFIYTDRRPTGITAANQYISEMAVYEGNNGPGAPDIAQVNDFSDVNAGLALEAELLAERGFRYVGDSGAIDVDDLGAYIREAFAPPDYGPIG